MFGLNCCSSALITGSSECSAQNDRDKHVQCAHTLRGEGGLLPDDYNYTEDEHAFNWNYQIRLQRQMPLEPCEAAHVNMEGDEDDEGA